MLKTAMLTGARQQVLLIERGRLERGSLRRSGGWECVDEPVTHSQAPAGPLRRIRARGLPVRGVGAMGGAAA